MKLVGVDPAQTLQGEAFLIADPAVVVTPLALPIADPSKRCEEFITEIFARD
jgi:hypothetical protein